MADDGLPVYIVGEDEVHRALAMALVRDVLTGLAAARRADWVSADDTLRWSALEEHRDVPEARRWTDIHRDVERATRRKLMGRIDGEPAGAGAHKLRGKLGECSRAARAPVFWWS